jgi:outer membrane protein OmpA-like peptidoglycan-associated protein
MKKFLLPILCSVAFTSTAFAQSSTQVNSINVQTYNPSTSSYFTILEDAYRAEYPRKSKTYFGLNYNYVTDPFVAINSTTGAEINKLIGSIQTFDMMVGFRLSSRFGLFFGLPIHMVTYPQGSAVLLNSSSSVTNTTIGDTKILGKIRLTDDDASADIALLPEIHLPTGNTNNFVSDASAYLGLRAVVEREFNKFTLNFNIGFAAASNSLYDPNSTNLSGTRLTTIDYRKRMIFGIGGYAPFSDTWGMSVEFESQSMIPFDRNNNPNELYVGLRHLMGDTSFTLGGSLGKFGGAAGQNYRIIAGLRLNLYEEEEAGTPTLPASPTPAAKPRVVFKPKQIELSEPVNFLEDSDVLTVDGKKLLDEVADVINKNRTSLKKIQIDGHTNNNGGETHNLQLSLNRSRSVRKYLVSKGIEARILEARGFGQMKPKVPNNNPKAVEVNRRVEFNVIQ